MKHAMNPPRLLLTFILSALLLAACGPAAQNEDLPPLKIAYTQWWGDYTILIAQEKGFFDKYNVKVEPIYYEVFSKAVPDLASEQIDGGTYILGDALSISLHTEVNVIALSDDGGLTHIIANSAIQTPKDLRGKSIGVEIGSAYELLVIEMLKREGISMRETKLVDVDAENVPAKIAEGIIQAGLTWEPYTSEALGSGNRTIFSSEEVPGLFANSIVVRSALFKERPADVANYLKAWFEAVEFRKNNLFESNQIIAEKIGISLAELSEDCRLFTLEDNLDLYQAKPKNYNLSVYDLAQLNVDSFVRSGKLSILPDLRQLFISTYLGQ